MEEKNEIISKNNENNQNGRIKELMKKYVESFSEKELEAYKIAQEHLKTSFSLEKSIGFRKYLKKMNQ
tara:strand:- start:173 stop:376 length:204 start_codon:yes stop_codon:yes gene_type:complete